MSLTSYRAAPPRVGLFWLGCVVASRLIFLRRAAAGLLHPALVWCWLGCVSRAAVWRHAVLACVWCVCLCSGGPAATCSSTA
jgi:hypothetical protein